MIGGLLPLPRGRYMSSDCRPPVLASDRRVTQLRIRLAPMPLVGPILHGWLVNLHYLNYGSSRLLMWLLLSKASAVINFSKLVRPNTRSKADAAQTAAGQPEGA